jgi:hypothetical protein
MQQGCRCNERSITTHEKKQTGMIHEEEKWCR